MQLKLKCDFKKKESDKADPCLLLYLLATCIAHSSTLKWRQYVPPKRRSASTGLHIPEDITLYQFYIFI
jgi:hypothetical protein